MCDESFFPLRADKEQIRVEGSSKFPVLIVHVLRSENPVLDEDTICPHLAFERLRAKRIQVFRVVCPDDLLCHQRVIDVFLRFDRQDVSERSDLRIFVRRRIDDVIDRSLRIGLAHVFEEVVTIVLRFIWTFSDEPRVLLGKQPVERGERHQMIQIGVIFIRELGHLK